MDLRPRMCHTCQRLHCTFFERAELMRLKVKDLRDYLHLHETPTQMCREKEELVELVLAQQAPRSSGSAESRSQPSAPLPSLPLAESEPLTEEEDEDEEEEEEEEEEGEGDGEEGEEDDEDDEEESTDSEETLVHSRRASLSDLSRVEDIEGLSVRQLKEILARNFVNYQGCCEKWELMEKVTHLFNDQKDLHNLVSNTKTEAADPAEPSGQEENLCKICMDSPIDCVLLECGHMVTCSKCGKRMNECPICRQYVVRAVHVFRS
ncbi:E3 ubiquitin-protein ligase rififylin [Ctenopharyngodon idella]|uniref:E3 ubiquitin-protein ligase rififylin n=1 Tax=Ctenopharyngodon idella TaxID=7959 RepID=UPI0022312972|nr:E3 ubiquitin-protein ligase rififylin [Ctenopharyngodon idella]XP_051734223.1 E3 ubiquitin-protein ligase rififylin [Ctenopharyngodon idella]